jgi:drug/metabolite transporter (DMT)-like permease
MNQHSVFEKKSVMLLTAMFCCLLWGSAFPSLKITYQLLGEINEFQKIWLAGLRFTLAGVGILVFAKLKMRTSLKLKAKEMPFILLIALLQTFGAYVLYYIGLGHTTAVKTAVLTSLSAFLVAIMSHFMTKNDRLGWKKGIGLLSGFAGVVIVNVSMLQGAVFSFSLLGEGLIVLHSVMIALTMVLMRKYGGGIDVVHLSGWQFFFGGLMLCITGYIGSPGGVEMNAGAIALLFYMAAIAGVAFTLWYVLLKYHNATLLEQYKFANPLFGTVLSVLFVPGEHIGIEMVAAVALVAAGMLIVNRQDTPLKRTENNQLDIPEESNETDTRSTDGADI